LFRYHTFFFFPHPFHTDGNQKRKHAPDAPILPLKIYPINVHFFDGLSTSSSVVLKHRSPYENSYDVIFNGELALRKTKLSYTKFSNGVSSLEKSTHLMTSAVTPRWILTSPTTTSSKELVSNPFQIPIGTLFFGRHDLALAVMHNQYRSGVHFRNGRVYSLLITPTYNSGTEYPDGSIDYDFSGGRKNPSQEQDLQSAANRALLSSIDHQHHVRVVRQVLPSASNSVKVNGAAIYRYDGLYKLIQPPLSKTASSSDRKYVRLQPVTAEEEKQVTPEDSDDVIMWQYTPPVYIWHGSFCHRCSHMLDPNGRHLSNILCQPPTGSIQGQPFTLSHGSLSPILFASSLSAFGATLVFSEAFLPFDLATAYSSLLSFFFFFFSCQLNGLLFLL
jgi:hypothetical protein